MLSLQEIIKDWKDEFHALPDQMSQQLRDSWKKAAGAFAKQFLHALHQ